MANEDDHDPPLELNEEEIFTITWRVKNYSMCPRRYIESPIFLIKHLGKGQTEWWLRVYPCKEDYVSCYLMRKTFVHKDLKMKFTVSLIPFSSDIELFTAETDFTQNDESWGIEKFIAIQDIVNDRHLPNDTFTIKCSVKFPNINNLQNIKTKVLKTLSNELIHPNTSLNSNKCFVETTIPVHIKRISWPIRNFLSLPENEIIAFPVNSVIKEIPSFFVAIIKSDTSINLEIKICNDFKESFFVRCTVSAAKTPKGLDYRYHDNFDFESGGTDVDNVWIFSPPLDLKELEENEYFKLNDGALYLQFQFTFSKERQVQHIEKQDWEPIPPIPFFHQVPLELFPPPTNNDEHTVVTLRAEGRNFTVHRALLKAKSDVFDAMFKNDMKEKATGVVNITDVDPQTLERMLSFLYCGTVGDLSLTDVKSLYKAVTKYQILPLMTYCSSVLMSSMTVSNVCDMLHLANLYKDDQLFKTAKDFVVANSSSIFRSQDWKDFMKTDLSLAADVMHSILIKGLQ